jgi:hypothetical protein
VPVSFVLRETGRRIRKVMDRVIPANPTLTLAFRPGHTSSTTAATQEACMNKTDYNRLEITYLTDNIKFADSKAGVLIGMDGLLLKAAIDYFKSAKITLESLIESLTFFERFFVIFGSLFLIIGIFLAIAVVFPRRSSGSKEGLIFWESIAKYPSPDEYTKELMNTTDDEIDRKMAEQQYYVSITATKKYNMLRRAFWASSIGALFITITAFAI